MHSRPLWATRVALLLLLPSSLLPQAECACDPAKPETMATRSCGLCREADKQPPEAATFILKDISPRKPNRWLALPRVHLAGHHDLHELPAAERTALWKAAIAEARQRFGDEWGLAYNGRSVRTQCHTHIHIGKLIALPTLHSSQFITVRRPEEIPAPPDSGVWVHPVGDRLHVHLGENLTETILFR